MSTRKYEFGASKLFFFKIRIETLVKSQKRALDKFLINNKKNNLIQFNNKQ